MASQATSHLGSVNHPSEKRFFIPHENSQLLTLLFTQQRCRVLDADWSEAVDESSRTQFYTNTLSSYTFLW